VAADQVIVELNTMTSQTLIVDGQKMFITTVANAIAKSISDEQKKYLADIHLQRINDPGFADSANLVMIGENIQSLEGLSRQLEKMGEVSGMQVKIGDTKTGPWIIRLTFAFAIFVAIVVIHDALS